MWDFFVDVIDDVSGGVGDLFKAAGDLTGVIQGGGKGESIIKQSGSHHLELMSFLLWVRCNQGAI